METKRCFRFFTIADYEQEQKWLNDMSRCGWNMINTTGVIYTFEKGVPGEYIYKIDLPNEQMTQCEIDTYYKFMEECGVEVVDKFKMWRYLRKKRSDGDFETTDNTLAQLAMINKAYGIANKTLNTIFVISTLVIVLCCLLQTLLHGNVVEFLEGVVLGISTSVIVVSTLTFVPIVSRLRKRMNTLVNDLQIKN